MKIIISALIAICTSFAIAGVSNSFRKAYKDMSPEEKVNARRLFIERTGGMIVVGSKGVFKFLLGDTRIDEKDFEHVIKNMKKYLKINVAIERINDATFSMRDASKIVSKTGATAAVFIVSDNNLPISLTAPEAKWGIVNVYTLSSDHPSKLSLARRVTTAAYRTAAIVLGASASQYPGTIMDPLYTANEIESHWDYKLLPDSMAAIAFTLPKLGIKQGVEMSYRRACLKGIAPHPVNDIQKAIWERVKAEKERGPTNPIEIPMPKKK